MSFPLSAQLNMQTPQTQYSQPRNAEVATATKPDGTVSVPTALLPRDVLAGREFQQGDELRFRIVHIFEDEIEVKLIGTRSGIAGAAGLVRNVGEIIMEAAENLDTKAKADALVA